MILKLAQTAASDIGTQFGAAGAQSGLGQQSLPLLVARIINGAFSLLGILFVVLIVYAGYVWMTAGGEEEKVTKAQGLIRNGVIGLVISLAAYAISYFVIRSLVRATVGGPAGFDFFGAIFGGG